MKRNYDYYHHYVQHRQQQQQQQLYDGMHNEFKAIQQNLKLIYNKFNEVQLQLLSNDEQHVNGSHDWIKQNLLQQQIKQQLLELKTLNDGNQLDNLQSAMDRFVSNGMGALMIGEGDTSNEQPGTGVVHSTNPKESTNQHPNNGNNNNNNSSNSTTSDRKGKL